MVALAYERWSYTRGSKYIDFHFEWETFGILKKWSLRRGGHLRMVVATGGSTVIAVLVLVSFISTHNQLLYFARFRAGPAPKIANKSIQQRTLPGFLTISLY